MRLFPSVKCCCICVVFVGFCNTTCVLGKLREGEVRGYRVREDEVRGCRVREREGEVKGCRVR